MNVKLFIYFVMYFTAMFRRAFRQAPAERDCGMPGSASLAAWSYGFRALSITALSACYGSIKRYWTWM